MDLFSVLNSLNHYSRVVNRSLLGEVNFEIGRKISDTYTSLSLVAYF